ncbi:MAG TPA: helix-turn-helix domain-containing protein [Solirubrobacteraceae bacterium]|nr:helix-turn-helix domain-containing protein [Solirubrobacteraceae bacterium]
MAASASSAATETPRARLIDALAEAIRAKGYRETTVADIVAGARTSRRTFYQHFADRGECFLALFEQETQHKLELIAAAVDPARPLEDQIEAAIDAYIDGVKAEPALQASFARELPGLAEAGADAVHAVTDRYAALLVALTEQARAQHPEAGLAPLGRDIAVILVGGLRELLVMAIGQRRDLDELRGPSAEVVAAILGTLRA